jgi:hypothetical protein
LHPAADGKLAETAALIRDPAMQREESRTELDECPRLIVPGEDHGQAFRAVMTPGQRAIPQPPRPEIARLGTRAVDRRVAVTRAG